MRWHMDEPSIVDDPELSYSIMRPMVWSKEQESLAVLAVDAKCSVIDKTVIAVGSVGEVRIDSTTILRWALTRDRPPRGVLIAHNHPSGDPTPSERDIKATKMLAKSCRTVGIALYDHIVIGDGDFVSIKEWLEDQKEKEEDDE